MIVIRNLKSPNLSSLSSGERDGVRGGDWSLEFGVYLEFVIWDLEFPGIRELMNYPEARGSAET
jgi:hypothetical protein